MAYEVVLQPEAIADLQEGISYYGRISEALGRKFHSRVESTLIELAQFPFYEVKYKDVRTRKIALFPYTIHFKFDEKTAIVRIYAIRFALMNPNGIRVVKEDEAIYSLV
jgi:hypothetical protein